MDLAQAPAGEASQTFVTWIITGLSTAVMGLAVYVRVLHAKEGKRQKEHGEELAASVERREVQRREFQDLLDKCERRADKLEREFRDHLTQSINILATARAAKSGPSYPRRPPAPTLEGMKKEFSTLSQVISPEDIRRAREDMDRTQ